MRARLLLCALIALVLAACAAPGGKREEVARINYELGVGYYRQGDYLAALEKLQKADKAQPGRVDVLMAMALTYQALGRWEAAERAFRRALERLQGEDEDGLPVARDLALAGDLHNNYGAFLCARGRYAAAEREFRAALADPGYRTPAVAWENLGLCALRAGERVKAEAALRRALALDPGRRQAALALSRLRDEGASPGEERTAPAGGPDAVER